MALLKKTSHVVFAVIIVVIGIYVYHMITNHQGQSMVPNFGTK